MEIANLEGFMSFDADSSFNDIDAIGRAHFCREFSGSRFRISRQAARRRTAARRLTAKPGPWHAWAEGPDEAILKVRGQALGFGLILSLKCGRVADGVEAAREIARATGG